MHNRPWRRRSGQPAQNLIRQDQAHAILDEVGAANLKVQMDPYHCRVAGVPNRSEPDRGEVSYPCLFALLDEPGYGGWVGCEYKPARGLAPGATSSGLGWLAEARRGMPTF